MWPEFSVPGAGPSGSEGWALPEASSLGVAPELHVWRRRRALWCLSRTVFRNLRTLRVLTVSTETRRMGGESFSSSGRALVMAPGSDVAVSTGSLPTVAVCDARVCGFARQGPVR